MTPLISHRFDVDRALEAYALIEGTVREPYLGIVITYPQEAGATPVAARAPRTTAAVGDVAVGVIGAGNFAKAFLIPAFAKAGARFQTICTAAGVSASTVAKKYGAPVATTDAAAVLHDPAVRLVVIATRHDSHAGYVVDALSAGKAVFVEKPPAITIDQLEQIASVYRAADTAGRAPFLMVGYNRRFSPLASVMRDALRRTAEPMSVIYRVNAGFVPASEWVHDPRTGGGRIIGEGGHFVDFITYLVGAPVVSVSASAIPATRTPKPDVATITVEFADGSMGTVHYFANGDPQMPKEYVEAFCGGVGTQLSNFRSLAVYGTKASGRTRYFNQVKGFAEEAEAVMSALRAGQPSPIPFDQLYATSKATLLVEHALTSGQKVRL
jgi:predicted dehydrogenase